MKITPEQLFDEEKAFMQADWEKMVSLLKERTTLPSQIAMEMFQKCFEAGWAGGSTSALRRINTLLDESNG